MLFKKSNKRGKKKRSSDHRLEVRAVTENNLNTRLTRRVIIQTCYKSTPLVSQRAEFNKLRSGEQATKSLVPRHIKSKKGLFLKSLVIMLSVTGFSLLPRVLPIMVYTGRLRPEGVPFSGLRSVYERVEILLVEVYETLKKSVRLGL